MKTPLSRRGALATFGRLTTGLMTVLSLRKVRAAVKHVFTATGAPKGYDPTQHKWLMAIDVNQCIGCGLCAQACKLENHVPEEPTFFRTWIERYIVKKPGPDADTLVGETVVDSPQGGINGFPPSDVPEEEVLRSFYVPKLCNLCENSPCVQSCPVGATFDTPDGAVLVDKNYCVGCGFCIQSCPYGCRFMNPETHTAEKCSLCYHRITRGLNPACVEVCPTNARLFGDLKNPLPDDPLQNFIKNNKVFTLKTHLGTHPRVLYAGMDKEVN